jgi:fumarylacetoacetate (FAA) hydrolase
VSAERALDHVKLILLVNDVTLRNVVPAELEKGFGFLVSKPATAFSPVAVTPDELGAAWRDGRVHLRLTSEINGAWSGDPEAGPEMHFHFGELIAHAAKTRRLPAGTIVGSGTVSNDDPARGVSCLAERRMREKIAGGQMTTPFLRFGDRVKIEMKDPSGASIFGAIEQRVTKAERP